MLWTQVHLFPMSLMLLYHLITVHVLWHAPFYGWLLLISAWARRAAFLWAVLPIIAIAFVEKIAFNTSHFATFLGDRLGGGAEAMTDAWKHAHRSRSAHHARTIPEHAGSVDRAGIHRAMSRRSGAAPPATWSALIGRLRSCSE